MIVRKPLEAPKTSQATRKELILFQNRNEALAVFPSAGAKAEDILAALHIQAYKSVILVLGGAAGLDEALAPRLTQLFSRGIARAAADSTALIIDGGTQSGVMAMMGAAFAGRGTRVPLIGVAPAGLVTYPGRAESADAQLEPNHSHFVLIEGDSWGDETATMFDMVRALTSRAPGVGLVVGGGPVSRGEVLCAVRQKLPLIVVEGTGALADEIAAAWKQKPALPADPVMAEIIDDGAIHLHLLSNSVKGIERLIIRQLGGENVLTQAWEIFADYDLNANIQRRRHNLLQLTILIVGVAGTALAISEQVFGTWLGIRQLLIIIPILLTVLVTAANRFKQRNKWLLLRAGAESIKREIYRYRARAKEYAEEPDKPSPEQQLSKNVEDITRRTMRTEVNTSALVPYNKALGFPPHMYAQQGGDDGFSYLTADRYVEVRLGDHLNYFHKTAVRLERELKVLYWLTFVVGGVGTYLAATGRQVWIAVTTAVVAAAGTYLGYRQTESSLTKYNQSATDLANVKTWWLALSAEDQSRRENINSLVEHTEQVLEAELSGWVQQMQNALAELRKDEGAAAEKREKGDTHAPVASALSPRHNGQRTDAERPKGEPAGEAKDSAETVAHQRPIVKEG